jgi:CubicO group peptidase (beta-lactamase class C family)
MASDFNSLDAELLDAIYKFVLPGAIVAVGQPGRPPSMRAFGNRRVEPATEAATLDTVYDLASLTKALVTSLLVMKGVEQGVLRLDEPLANFVPALEGRPEATLRLALAHAAGFAAHRRFYEAVWGEVPSAKARAAVVEHAAQEPAAYVPGTRSIYSDLGFILVGAAVERAFGARLDHLAERMIFGPLRLRNLGFVDLMAGPAPGSFRGHPVAPTQRCRLRDRLVVGEVHDLNAYAMGGIAGHAGLFGSVEDVLKLTTALCDAYRGGGREIVHRDVLRLFWQPAGVPDSTWRLGWDGPSAQGSLAGSLISRAAVGHLAFTGCSLWIDPEQAAFVIVLANRIHPEVRDDARFRALRPAINDAALRAIGYQVG